jgi:hypothetical protein
MWRSSGASALLQLILSADLFFATAVGHGHPRSSVLVACGAVQSRLPTTPLRLRGGCDSGAAGLEERLKALISQAPVMLFMKGEPDVPQCGFSRCAVCDTCPAPRRSREQHVLVFARAHSLTQPIATCVLAGRLWRCCASTTSCSSTSTFSKMKRCARA